MITSLITISCISSTYQGKGNKDNELDQHKEVRGIQIGSVENVDSQGLQIGGNKTHVCTHESDLRDSDCKQNRPAHVRSIKMSSDITK